MLLWNIKQKQMKKFYTLIILFSFLISCKSNQSIKDELIFIIQMEVMVNKSDEEIEEFSKYYTNAINLNEPNSLGFGFFNAFGGIQNKNDRIILIERYSNQKAMMEHARNISEGGVLENDFNMFKEHFNIQKVDVYGNTTNEFRQFLKPFGLTFYFHPTLSKFSRN